MIKKKKKKLKWHIFHQSFITKKKKCAYRGRFLFHLELIPTIRFYWITLYNMTLYCYWYIRCVNVSAFRSWAISTFIISFKALVDFLRVLFKFNKQFTYVIWIIIKNACYHWMHYVIKLVVLFSTYFIWYNYQKTFLWWLNYCIHKVKYTLQPPMWCRGVYFYRPFWRDTYYKIDFRIYIQYQSV